MRIDKAYEAFRLKDILSKEKYIIPIYQRNYAWGKVEISQLINDIFEYFEINSEKYKEEKSYYLGSLVCFKREDGSFELIDGQQRHTTMSLINLVLKNWNDQLIKNTVPSTNLKFDSRKNTQNFLEELYSDFAKLETTSLKEISNIQSAIGIINEELHEKKDGTVELFAQYFYNNVKLFRIEVPQNTDLNHYFEILNNRGEQLEKHEIVKALLIGKLKNQDEQEKFAAIWDACSDMSEYVYFNFNSEIRKQIFDANSNIRSSSFADIPQIDTDKICKEETLSDIINNYNVSENFPKEEKQTIEKYRSVTDFSNFLLQLLKLKYGGSFLDDKKLLAQFNLSISNGLEPQAFIYDLLKYRTIFDKYIVKQDLSDGDENKQNWDIRKLNETFDNVIKSIEDDDELVKLQTMLYYSNPTNTNNNWVHEILEKEYFNNDNYSENLFAIAKVRFKPTSQEKLENFIRTKLKYPEITVFELYFIDFLLWKLYKNKIQGQNNQHEKGTLEYKIYKNKELFYSFKFKQFNSKEHLLPQAKAGDEEKLVLNNLGNLCLISTSQNSAGNKEHPIYKKRLFANDNSSLKRLIMFESFENENWGIVQIQKHEEEILELIKSYLS